MVFENTKKHNRSHSRSHSSSNMGLAGIAVGIPTSASTSNGTTTPGRRPSLTRKRSSQRLIKTINIDFDDTISFNDDFSDTSETRSGVNNIEEVSVISDDKIEWNESALESLSIHNKTSNIPNLSSLKIANGGQENRGNSTGLDFIEVPYVKAILDASLPDDYLKDDILNIIQTLRIPKWFRKGYVESPYDRNLLTLNKISGAMTNAIFKIEYRGLPSLLLRIYGKNNDSIIDRDYELQILARLSIQNIGPSLYGCFENGRFEQFLENATTLTKEDIRDWNTSQRIARRMKELHSGVPLLKAEFENGPASWQKIDKWVELIEEHPNWISDDERIKFVFNCVNWTQFKTNIQKYKQWLFKSQSKSPLVFCHNDTQYGNLLFNSPLINTPASQTPKSTVTSDSDDISDSMSSLSPTSTQSLFPSTSNVSLDKIINPTRQDQIQDKKLVVIDFEYSGPNPASYDLANHFSEWMHDYSCSKPWSCNPSLFPSKEQLLNFLYSYVSHLKGSSILKKRTTKELEDEVRYYYNEVLKWRGTPQLFWSSWAVIQSGELQKNDEELEEEFDGINGEKYIITVDPLDKHDEVTPELEEEASEGVNIDTFDYLKYCSDKISVFWGDLIGLGIITREDVVDTDKVQWLDVKLL
ncbi:choline kinase [Monosporozyma unispora]|nr:hypothetical protein C6P44_001833 [Kazachstania unispora]